MTNVNLEDCGASSTNNNAPNIELEERGTSNFNDHDMQVMK